MTIGLEGSWYFTSHILEWPTVSLHSDQGPNVTSVTMSGQYYTHIATLDIQAVPARHLAGTTSTLLHLVPTVVLAGTAFTLLLLIGNEKNTHAKCNSSGLG